MPLADRAVALLEAAGAAGEASLPNALTGPDDKLRRRDGFTLAELPEVMATLHRRGVKGYVTFNTLVFDHELREAVRTIEQIAQAGADALIVQDMGILQMDLPPIQLHASTQCDIRDADACARAVNGVDYVLHQAALGSVPRSLDDPWNTHDNNINGFLRLLIASRDAGVKRFVYAASSSTYGDHPGLPKVEEQIGKPLSPYAVTKYVNELYGDVFARAYGVSAVGLRYFNVFGPERRNLRTIGAATGRAEATGELIDAFTDRARQTGATTDAPHFQASIVQFTDTTLRVYGAENFPASVLANVGVDRPAAQRFTDKPYLEIGVSDADLGRSPDLSAADGDIVYLSFASPAAKQRAPAILESQAWRALSANRDNRVFVVNNEVWQTGQGIIAARGMLDDLHWLNAPIN
mgnify:CR=1 FL=1